MNNLIKAIDAPKNHPIWKYSNPFIVQQKAEEFFNTKDVNVYLSNQKNKKYMIILSSGEKVHFGQMPYEDFTKHNNIARRTRYLQRANAIKGGWKNHISPNLLSINLLW